MKKLMLLTILGLMVFSFGVVEAIECSEADYDGDGDVDFMDVFKLRQCINISVLEVDNVNCSFFDYDGSGMVEENDLVKYREWNLKTCPVEKFCNDSDGGLDYYVKGVEYTQEGSKEDYCLSEDRLVELYCVGDEPESENYNCPNGCSDGACVTRGYTSVIDDLSPPIDFILMAELENGLKVKGIYQTGDVKYNHNINVGDLHDSLTVFAYEMKLAVIVGKNLEASSVITADTIKTILLGLMDTKSVYVISSADVKSDDLKLLVSASNETINETDVIGCVDSDGSSSNIYIKGTVTGATNLNGGSFTDICKADKDGYYLMEGSCINDEEYNQGLYECPNGCYNGACLEKYNFYEDAIITCKESSGVGVQKVSECYSPEKWLDYALDYCEDNCLATDFLECGLYSLDVYNICDGQQNQTQQINDSSGSSSGGGSGGGQAQSNLNESIVIGSCDDGCLLDEKCFNFGYRRAIDGELKYCFESGNWTEQKSGGESCDNSFECDSNLCVDSECVSAGFFKRIMNWFARWFS